MTTSRPSRTPRASSASRCSVDCGIHPESAATTNIVAGTGPTPASICVTNRSCPGTSTNATGSDSAGSVVQAKPRSIVMPRRRSSAQRSGSIPVSARTSVDLPWSTWPAVATTLIPELEPAPGRSRPRAGRRPRAAPSAGRPRTAPARRARGRDRRPGAAGSAASTGRATPALASSTPGAPPPPTWAAQSTATPPTFSASAAARTRRSSTSASSIARTGGSGPRSVASSAASVSLSTRSARARGWRRRRCTRSASPNTRPACGPPSSLSPDAVTRVRPARSSLVASGSAGRSGCGASSPDPMSDTTGTPSPTRSATGTDDVNPVTTKFDGWTLRIMPVSGPTASA